MKKKIASIILVIALVMGGMFVNVDNNGKVASNNYMQQETKLKEYDISSKQLNEIARVAAEDGKKAAKMVNEYDGFDFEAGVNKALTEYYSSNNNSEMCNFIDNIDDRANNIVEGYAEAAEERKKADKLSYEAGTTLLTFGANITEKEIKDIVKDQYGECEYIYEYMDGTHLVKVNNSLGLTVDKAMEAYGEYSETMQIARNDKVEQIAEAYQYVNDTYAANQYYLRTMNAVDAWLYIRSVNHSKIKVAVIDGGADLNSADLHASSDLSAAILSDNSHIPLRQSSPMYNNSHGTMVAGVLAGTANNGTQIAGVASCINNDVAELINVKIDMYVDKIAVGLDYARQVGAKVANLSLAHDGSNSVEEAAINNFVAAGGTVVAGAGNSATDAATYPSDYANTISVISVDENYNIAGSSNRGWAKDICAPGVSIYAPNVTGQGSDTVITGGTSLASPMVAAVVTMMYSVNPGINSETVKTIIRNTAKDLGEPGRDWTYAYGFINAYSAVVQAAGGKTPETTTQSDGLSECTKNNNTLVSYWGYYVGEWAGATARYSAGSGWDPMTLKITANGGLAWGVQAFTAPVMVTAGRQYNVSITLNSDRAGARVLFKEDTTSTELETRELNTGDNTFSGTFTATGDTAEFFFDLGAVPAGTTIKTMSIGMTEVPQETQVPETTVPETTTRETVVTDWMAVEASNEMYEYRNATNIDVVNVQQPGFAAAQGVYMSTSEGIGSIKINGVTAGDESLAIQGAGALVYLTSIPESGIKVEIYSTTGAFLGSVELKKNPEPETTTEAPTEEPTEAPTEEPTTKPVKTIEGGIEINGYQVSATVGGMRTVYSVDSEIEGKKVVSSGIIYGLSDYASETDMYVGSASQYVRNYASTAAGVSSALFTDSDIATSYAMTMRFGAKTAAEYNAGWRIRAYAQLEDGTYVYTKAYTYKIYDIADSLYQNKKMNTKEQHEYLYNDILRVVNKDYASVDYDWSNIIVKM